MFSQIKNQCAVCGRDGQHQHHLFPRSTHKNLIDEPRNLIWLCSDCHTKAHSQSTFLIALQEIFYNWKPKNLELYLRAEATIESLLSGQDIEFFTPAMISAYLNLATAQYSRLSEQMTKLEKNRPLFFLNNHKDEDGKKVPVNQVEYMYQATFDGQKMIEFSRKLKSLEKLMSSLKNNIQRYKIDYSNQKY